MSDANAGVSADMRGVNAIRTRLEPAAAARLIFIVGSSRSGTTMMGRILGGHSDVFTFKELHFFEQMWSEGSDSLPLQPEAVKISARLFAVQRQGYLKRHTPELFADEASKLVYESRTPVSEIYARFLQYEAQRCGKQIPCDQTPRNLFYLKEIFEWFPQAIVINMIRDPRDVLLSQKNKWRRRLLGATDIPVREAIRARLNYHPITVTRLWLSAVRTAEKFVTDPRFISIRFEMLLRQPIPEVTKVCELAGLDFQSDMLNIPYKGSSTRSDEPSTMGMDSSRAEAWRRGDLSRTEVFVCERLAGEAMERLGYEKADTNPNFGSLLLYLIFFPVHLIIAVLANLGRVGNIVTAIKRRVR